MTEKPRRPLTLKRDSDTAPEAPRLEERLHKVLAQAGLGSRRALEQRIADGLVKVNGETAQVGMSVTGGDKIELDGRTFVATALTEPSRSRTDCSSSAGPSSRAGILTRSRTNAVASASRTVASIAAASSVTRIRGPRSSSAITGRKTSSPGPSTGSKASSNSS